MNITLNQGGGELSQESVKQISDYLLSGHTATIGVFDIWAEGDEVALALTDRGVGLMMALRQHRDSLSMSGTTLRQVIEWALTTTDELESAYRVQRRIQIERGANKLFNRRHILPGGVIALDAPPRRRSTRNLY
jgi:hypothetical protein